MLREFAADHPQAKEPLDAWFKSMKKAAFKSTAEVKAAFPSVDFPSQNRAVFDIGGNKYRLVAGISFKWSAVYVKGVFTHAAYDKLDVTEL